MLGTYRLPADTGIGSVIDFLALRILYRGYQTGYALPVCGHCGGAIHRGARGDLGEDYENDSEQKEEFHMFTYIDWLTDTLSGLNLV